MNKNFWMYKHVPEPKFYNDKLIVKCEEDIVSFCIKRNCLLYNFNHPIIIPDDVTDCSGLLSGCNHFNQPITIPSHVTNCSSMFAGCNDFNQPVHIPDSVTDCSGMFTYCKSFNQPLEIPSNVIGIINMLFCCNKFNSSITFKDNLPQCYEIYEEYDKYELQKSVFRKIVQYIRCPNNVEFYLPDIVTINLFDELFQYSTSNGLIEMTARLLQFKHDNLAKFEDKKEDPFV